jgi:hypothetical protein
MKQKNSTKKTDSNKMLISVKEKQNITTNTEKLKVVSSFEDIKKLDLEGKLVPDTKKLAVDLYRYMKDHTENVVYKNGFVLYRDYKLYYTDIGLTILDQRHYSKIVSHGLGAHPKYEDIVAYLNSRGVDKLAIKKKKLEEAAKVNEILQSVVKLIRKKDDFPTEKTIKRLYKRFISDKNISDEVKEKYSKDMHRKFPYLAPKEEIDLVAQRKKAILMIKRTKKVSSVIAKMHRFIPHRSFNVYYGKLLRKFKKGDIRASKFLEQLIELIKDDKIFAEKKKSPGIFICKPAYTVGELLDVTDTHITFRNNTGEYTVTKSKFLAYYILHEETRVNVALMKFFNKELTAEQVLEKPIVRDRFTIFDYRLLDGEHNVELFNLLEELLYVLQLYNPLDAIYKNQRPDLNINDKVKVVWYNYKTFFYATVIKLDNGIKVRYEDGTVELLYHFQKVIKITQ